MNIIMINFKGKKVEKFLNDIVIGFGQLLAFILIMILIYVFGMQALETYNRHQAAYAVTHAISCLLDKNKECK